MSCYPDNWRVDKGNADSNTVVLFAHGAGADMDSEFMVAIAQGLAANGLDVVRFNFPYMAKCRLDGKRRPPDRAPALLENFRQQLRLVTELFAPDQIILMGKSMGGRMAIMLASEDLLAEVRGVICLGYPFLPKGKLLPRLEPLQQCRLPLMIFQGERDSFGGKVQIPQWHLPTSLNLNFVDDGDHSFVPRKAAATSLAMNYAKVIDGSLSFIRSLL
ncbi:alpha/beta fold hydrolase [Shewanella yunxiaonensis]|nr:alpha/beta fold hydrolase [Shewanella yunxiaonensis]